MDKTNSVGTTFRAVAMKSSAPFGEHWVQVIRVNGVTEGIGQFNNSFNDLNDAEDWIDKNMEDPKYL